MATMAKGGAPSFMFNIRKVLNHKLTVYCATGLLAILVLSQIGSMVWEAWLDKNEPSQSDPVVIPSSTKYDREPLNNLTDYPLIQTAAMRAAQGAASFNAPETSLRLKLVGLMYSTDEEQARAIIESAEDGALSYAIHERVADNAEIYSIGPDRVILLHSGVKEALLLNPDSKSASAPASAEAQAASRPGRARASAPGAPVAGQRAMSPPKNTAELMREFSATPVMENGELLGFQLKALRNPGILEEFGITPNDVITEVNGVALNAPGRVMVLLDKLKKQREFEVTLSNGGNRRTITVNLYE